MALIFMATSQHAVLWLLLAAVRAQLLHAHPQYLDDFPNGHSTYFTTTMPGDGAVGHEGDRSGAHLNAFGDAYKRAGVSLKVSLFQSCTAEDFEGVFLNHADDDDDDHHHHHGAIWTLKFCCNDADQDGQPNGLELGDPCCRWKDREQVRYRITPEADHVSHSVLCIAFWL